MELFAWLAIGLLAGVAASLAARRGQAGRLATVAAGAGAAVVAGLVVNAVVGDLALVRVSLLTSNSYGTVSFGLAPAIAATVAAVATLVSLQRTSALSSIR